MQRSSVLRIVATCFAILTAGAPTPAWSDPVADDGRPSFESGVRLFAEGNFAAALVDFRRSYTISHKRSALWNIAKCQRALGDYVGAATTLQTLQAEFTDSPKAERQAAATELAEVSSYLGSIQATVEPGAQWSVDGVRATTEEVPLSVGKHLVEVRHAVGASTKREIEVASGEHVTLDLAVASGDLGAAPPTSPWVYAGATVAAAGALTAAGGFLLRERTIGDMDACHGAVSLDVAERCATLKGHADTARIVGWAGVGVSAVGLGLLAFGLTRTHSSDRQVSCSAGISFVQCQVQF